MEPLVATVNSVAAATIDRGLFATKKAHGQKNADRGYPLRSKETATGAE